jgi:hypothetical protein
MLACIGMWLLSLCLCHLPAGSAGTDVWAFSSCLLDSPTVRIISDSYFQVALRFWGRCPGVRAAACSAKEDVSFALVQVLQLDVCLQAVVALCWCVTQCLWAEELDMMQATCMHKASLLLDDRD